MAATLMPAPRQRFVDNDGIPLANGMVFTFAAGTSDPLAAFTDPDGLIPHANPIRLDIRGEATIYWLGNYKVDVRNSLGIQLPGYPVDNFNAPDPASNSIGIAAAVATFFSSVGSSLIGFIQSGVGATTGTVQNELRQRMTPQQFGAKGDGTTDDTMAFQRMLTAYSAAMQSYQASAPNVFAFSSVRIEIPAGRYVCGALTCTANALRITSSGAIIKVNAGVSWITGTALTIVDVSGLSITGGNSHFVTGNSNTDGSMFDFDRCSFHDTTDWPVICAPNEPNGLYEVNHLSGVLTMTKCRWYNTNGIAKTYFDRTVIRDSYATLFAPGAATGGRWQADRSAIENRSLGDGLLLDNFFAVPVAGNGNFGNVWVDNYPGAAGHVMGSSGGIFDNEYAGGTAPVSYGGSVYATACRFGTETGGVPIVRNWCHGLGGKTGNGFGTVFIVLDNCFQMASGNGGTTANTGSVILKKGVPNAIVIRNSKGPVGESLINADAMVDLGNAPSNIAYWLDGARCGNYRCSVNIEGINRAVTGFATIMPQELIPYSQYDMTEDGRRRKYHMPLLNGVNIEFGSVTMESDQFETFVKGTAFGGALRIRGNSAAATDRGVWLGRTDATNTWKAFLKVDPDSGATEPADDNSYSSGSASKRWNVVYAGTATISTSDANEKQQIAALSAAEKAVALKIKSAVKRFKFNDAVKLKGDSARFHIGVIAQDVAAAFVAEGLDPSKYGLFCSDTWVDDSGVTHTRKGIRYEELLAFMISSM